MEMTLWNILLSAIVAIMGFLLKGKFEEIQRLGILINRTREEVARDHITRAEFRADMQQLMDRFDRLERKLDSMIRHSPSSCDDR
jgi:Tfp pilus assembly protein PilO